MRHAWVLAILLVLATAGAVSAAEMSFAGYLELSAETNRFIGPFSVGPFVRMDLNVADAGDNWSVDARLRAEWTGSSASVSIHRYRGVFNTGSITSTVARNFALGNVVTPFNWVVIASNPGDQLRVGANLAGMDVLTQLHSGSDRLFLRAQTDAGAATIGTGMRLKLDDVEQSDYTGYLTTSLGMVNMRAIVGSFAGDSQFALGASMDLTDELNVGATYADASRGAVTKGYAVNATFTPGLMQAKASFAEEDSALSASLVYRGSEDNVAFADLFDDDEWDKNVAPAFGVFFKDSESASAATITLRAVFPAGDNFVGRAHFEVQGDTNAFGAEGLLGLSEKATFHPYFSKTSSDVTTFGSNFTYAVSDNADITVTAERTTYPSGGAAAAAAASSHSDLLKIVYGISF